MPSRIAVPRTLPRLASGAAVLAVGLAGLTACGGSGNSSNSAASSSPASSSSAASSAASSSSGGGSMEMQALTATEKDFSIALDRTALTAGSYTITVKNAGNATHDLAVAEDGKTKATSDKVGPGQSTTFTVDLDAGKYTFFCSIGNHRTMGMELTVQVK